MSGASAPSPEFRGLESELVEVFGRGVEAPLGDAEFEAFALRCFELQYRMNPVYRGFADARGASPETIERWADIPVVPVRAFRRLPLTTGPAGAAEAVFRTSGTTGSGARGAHHVLSLDLYRASLIPNFAAHVMPESSSGPGGGRMPVLSLLPSPDALPDSSLSYMMGVVTEEFGAPGGGFFVDPGSGLAIEAFRGALEGALGNGGPVLVAGTAFAFVHLLDVAGREGWSVSLPPGSRVMETGGYKGRSRTLTRNELHGALERLLGVPRSHIVNEYGMTEMLSQFYLSPLRHGVGVSDHRPPPWVRTRVVDAVSLAPVETGPGLLAHLDLANLGTVCALLTEDVGVRTESGFELRGRAEGAEPRGCSLAAEELFEIAERAG